MRDLAGATFMTNQWRKRNTNGKAAGAAITSVKELAFLTHQCNRPLRNSGSRAALSEGGARVESLKEEFLSRVGALAFFPHQENITLPTRAFATQKSQEMVR